MKTEVKKRKRDIALHRARFRQIIFLEDFNKQVYNLMKNRDSNEYIFTCENENPPFIRRLFLTLPRNEKYKFIFIDNVLQMKIEYKKFFYNIYTKNYN